MSLKKNIYLFIGIFFSLVSSRLIPHPPNFTVMLALSFYVPAIFGSRYIFFVLLSFALTDLLINYHYLTHWTWGSVLLIGLLSVYFTNSVFSRMSGALLGTLIFFMVTNFGVWTTGMYGYTSSGLVTCYIMAIPFYAYTVISTLIFSLLIEICCKFYKLKFSNI